MAAQQVQRSAFPDGSNYRSNDARAIAIRKALWNGAPAHIATAPHSVNPVHVVRPGDTLFAIAHGWGVTLKSVKNANPNAGHPAGNFDNIHPGDRITHP
jgi:LysM repeat protein